jgi:hypothetical protein
MVSHFYKYVFSDFETTRKFGFIVSVGICEICNENFWYKKYMKFKPKRCGRNDCLKAKTEKQKESYRRASVKYKENNREKIRKSQNDYYNEHKNERKEKRRVYNRQYYQEHQDYFLNHSKVQYSKKKNKYKEGLEKKNDKLV